MISAGQHKQNLSFPHPPTVKKPLILPPSSSFVLRLTLFSTMLDQRRPLR